MPDLSALALSLQVAVSATLLLVPPGILAAWWFVYGRPFPGKVVLQTVLTLPLVLPPTVVGFYLLLLLGRGTLLGRWLNDTAGLRLLFTWQGAAVAAAVMALPLFVITAAAAFGAINHELLEAARMMGAREWGVLASVIIPLSYRGLLAALTLAFARALGEFGATLIVAGSIPGRTQTLPLALYSSIQAGNSHDALVYTLLLSVLALLFLWSIGAYRNRTALQRGGAAGPGGQH